jgi:excisionase family DNA binding protein
MTDRNGSHGGGFALAFPDELVDAIAESVRERLEADGLFNGTNIPPLLTVDEAATYLRCSRQAVYDRVHQGAIEPLRDGRRLLFRRVALDAYLEGRAA